MSGVRNLAQSTNQQRFWSGRYIRLILHSAYDTYLLQRTDFVDFNQTH